MKRHCTIGVSSVALQLLLPTFLLAQSDEPTIALTVGAGRALEVVLDHRFAVKSLGQTVTGILVEPIYAYDRIVVPSGTRVLGHVAALEGPSTLARTRAILSGNLSPMRHVVLQFDTLMPDHADPIPIQTVVTTEIPHLKRSDAPEPREAADTSGLLGRAEREAKDRVKESISSARQRGRDVLAEITQPGRTDRLKEALLQRSPYRPLAIGAGTGYRAELLAPLDFGRATPIEAAPPATHPVPASILSARLLTALDSSKTPRGTPIRAIVTEPVFSGDRQLIFPEGTVLSGEVTFAKSARWFHRNGQLRFLFESVQAPATEPAPLSAALQSVHASDDDHVTLDEEGGARVESSKTRFVAPALALLALRGTLDRHEHLDPDGDGHIIRSSNPGATSVGGFMGLGLLGIPLSRLSPPVGVTLSAVGAVRSLYANVLGKGREVQFPADTFVRLQLAPGPSPAP